MPWTRPDPTPPLSLAPLPRYGVWGAAIPNPDLFHAKIPGIYPAFRRLRYKAWQHYALITPHLYVSFAALDVGYLRSAWVQLAPLTGEGRRERKRATPWLPLSVSGSLEGGRTEVRLPDLKLEIQHAGPTQQIRLVAPKGPDFPEFSLEATIQTDEPLVVCLPLPNGSAMFSHKAPFSVRGSLTIEGVRHALNPGESTALLDWHQAYYPAHTWWKWATFAGFTENGRRLALNLTHNLALDEATLTENALWLDGECSRLGPARFEVGSPGSPWRIRTEDGADLAFTPLGERRENTRVGPVRSLLRQPYGTFTGTLPGPSGLIRLGRAFGLCEDHDARW